MYKIYDPSFPLSHFPPHLCSRWASSLLWYPALEAKHDGLCLLKKKRVCRWVIYEQRVMAHSSSAILFFSTHLQTPAKKLVHCIHCLCFCNWKHVTAQWFIHDWFKGSLSAIWKLSCGYVQGQCWVICILKILKNIKKCFFFTAEVFSLWCESDIVFY